LRHFRAAETLVCIGILLQSANIEIFADVLACLNHGLHAIGGLLGLEDLIVEGLFEAVAAL
jgi:hypothetical protein